MNTKEYFEKRTLQTEKHSKDRGEKYLKDLEKAYIRTHERIKKDIENFYIKYADEFGQISNIDSKRPLTSNETAEYDKNIRSVIENSNLSDEDKKVLVNSYLKGRLDRLNSLLNQTELNLRILTVEYEISSIEHLEENYKHCYSETAHTFYNCPTFDFDISFHRFDGRVINAIVNTKWSNKNYSNRIWGHYRNMARESKNILTVGIALGYSVDKISREVAHKMSVNYSNAKRLIRTESNYILSEATHNLYKDVGLEKYQFLATLDFKTSEICQSLDNKVFFVKDRKIGVNCNPMHPNCRSTTIPYLEEYQDEDDTRLARDVDGKNYEVPANYDYKAWYESMPEKSKEEIAFARKMYFNKALDEKQYEKYKEVLGNNAPKSIEEFQKMKYNDDTYDRLKKDYKAFKAIDKNVNISQENKQRAKDLYYSFKNEGIYVSDHFVERYIDRELKRDNEKNYSFEKIVEIVKNEPNYIDIRNDRQVLYYEGIGVIRQDDKCISLIKGRVSKYWKKIE